MSTASGFKLLFVFVALSVCATVRAADGTPPNIIIILGDDIGYGDIGCYGATAVKTPNVDRVAKDGLKFLNAHATSATCTPSRYSLITGQYAFRKKGTDILPGDAALIVPTQKATLPSILKKAGYTTGLIGKWHLGLGAGKDLLDWNAEIKPGPREVGFDYSFIMAATGDRVPCVYIENQKIVGLDITDPIQVNYEKAYPGEPTGISERDRLKIDWSHGHNNAIVNGIGRIGFMKGGKAALWKDEDMADTFTKKGIEFIEQNKARPFFLYFATHNIHVPRVPNPRFTGATTMGPRGDSIAEFDASVGDLLETLDRLNLTNNTLVIITSDNGPVLDDGYKDNAVEKLGDHKPAGPYRGGKYTVWEGGTRMPFIVRWPGHVKPGTSDAMISQVDFCGSFAAWTGQQLGPDDAPDSLNLMPELLGESKTGRDYILEQGNRVAIRTKRWKFIPGGPKSADELYDLDADAGETKNVARQNPDIVKDLSTRLDELKQKTKTRP